MIRVFLPALQGYIPNFRWHASCTLVQAADHNVGERLAFFIRDTAVERIAVRSRFVHHGNRLEDSSAIQPLMQYAWEFFLWAIRHHRQYESRDALVAELELLSFFVESPAARYSLHHTAPLLRFAGARWKPVAKRELPPKPLQMLAERDLREAVDGHHVTMPNDAVSDLLQNLDGYPPTSLSL